MSKHKTLLGKTVASLASATVIATKAAKVVTTTINAELADAKEAWREIREQQCPNCGTWFSRKGDYCPSCGILAAVIFIKEEKETKKVATCPTCSKIIPENAKYCIYCGKSRKEETRTEESVQKEN